jgi:hypothetical protein
VWAVELQGMIAGLACDCRWRVAFLELAGELFGRAGSWSNEVVNWACAGYTPAAVISGASNVG